MSGPQDLGDLKEFVVGFVVEAEEYLDSVNRNLVAVANALTKNRAEPRAVRELFRSLHTIKGLAAMVGAEPIVAISHEMEDILRRAERAGGRVSELTLDLLVQGTRALEERIQATSAHGVNGIPAAPTSLIEALATSKISSVASAVSEPPELVIPPEILKSFSPSDREQVSQALAEGHRVILINFEPSPENAASGLNITSIRERLSQVGELIKVVPRSMPQAPTGIVFTLLLDTQKSDEYLSETCGIPLTSIKQIQSSQPLALPASTLTLKIHTEPKSAHVEAEPAHDDASPSAGEFHETVEPEWIPTENSSIRVDIRRLDEALERLSELVVTRSKLARALGELTGRGVDTRDISAIVSENTRQLKRLRAAITKSRMVALSELFQRLPLVVRGLTKGTDKSVQLRILVGSAEVDKAVADKIFPAIVHLIRNAVDHAIETKTERRAAGKPETATISVVCDDISGSNLVLSMNDDGRGINAEAVASKSGRPVARTNEELLEQITLPGLSTQTEVSRTSGRGMGMDIVRRTVEILGGLLSLTTERGVGTTFTLQIPVSVTIVDIFSFISGGQVFAVPVSMVVEIIEVDPLRLARVPIPLPPSNSDDKQDSFNLNCESRLIQRRGEAIPYFTLESVLFRVTDTNPTRALIVNQLRGGSVAFGVDKILGQQEVVIRPLRDALVQSVAIVGATDLGDGIPTLIVDLANLGSTLGRTRTENRNALETYS